MTVPDDVQRFEVLLYLSLLLDALTAAFLGVAPADADGRVPDSVNLFFGVVLAALVYLVWLAARRRKNWARWALLGFFVFSLVLYGTSFGQMPFTLRMVVEIASMALSIGGFYFPFTHDARRWFTSSNP